MSDFLVFLPFSLPVIFALFVFVVPKKDKFVKEGISVLAVLINLVIAIFLFGKDIIFTIPWLDFGKVRIDFAVKLYQFSGFILLAAACFAFLIVIYSIAFMKGKQSLRQFYSFLLITLGFVNGAVLANNLEMMMFFWEGLLVTLFAMIMTGGKSSQKTAVKALVLVGISDICLMLGIGLVAYLNEGVLTMDRIVRLPVNDFLSAFAFVMLLIGAITKAGALPLHRWIPDAAEDSPVPFMAYFPSALGQLLGIYFLARICLDFFKIDAGSSMSILTMSVGSATIVVAGMMAIIQKDYKKILSYTGISQVGFMILGIGTALPIGIVGGLFYMINSVINRSCLFLTGGSVEKQTGTTELAKLGGLAGRMPVTMVCFIITACASSGIPPFNGFFSNALVTGGAFESGIIFYIAALLGTFLITASLLKLGHAVFFGPKSGNNDTGIKDPSWLMLIPMIIIAGFSILFGVYNTLPLKNLVQPVLGDGLEGHDFSGINSNLLIAIISMTVIILAVLNHIFGVNRTKNGAGALDHIRNVPVLSTVYDWAEKDYFDPYKISMLIINGVSWVLFKIDRGINWLYDVLAVKTAEALSLGIRKAHNGNFSMYILWSIVCLVILFIIYVRW
jgi:formate hydrogenlyase subunit 3/multisubunit Na+/H+ antiporter MnhD subunit